ncbi:MAG: YggS family pyridoxal phosphate-dependent enzyme [Treponema sp.]|nr:YggS family pyridoxal phosphate-dependent enzyme [Treponema sp.]
MSKSEIEEKLLNIKNQIHLAEKKASAKSDSVRLCAVSKFHPAQDVIDAFNAGQILFGENRVQEATEKFTEINQTLAAQGVNKLPELHIIGSLQSNKVKKAVSISSCIQSVDRIELLEDIEKHCAGLDKQISVFFEYHTAEDSKSGYESEDDLFRSLERCASGDFPHVIPAGLMTMAPFVQDEKLIRKSFITLRNLRDSIHTRFPSLPVRELSMGMSGDFLIAIEEGSTMVRIGTAIFGERNYQ